jgi:hypothetical protein
MFRIYDQFIPPSYQKALHDEMFSSAFPWHFIGSTLLADPSQPYHLTDMGSADSGLDTPQMYHTFYNKTFGSEGRPSSHYYMVKPLLYFIEQQADITITEIHRIKANMLTSVEGVSGHHIPHIDERDPDHMSLIYYVNDSDGATVFFDQIGNGRTCHSDFTLQHQQTPRQGSAVLFDSNRFHASSMPLLTPARAVINFIFRYVPNI